MAQTFGAIKARLNTELRDTGDKTFTDAEKTEALTRAIDEEIVSSVVEIVVPVVANQRLYPQASTVKNIYDIGLDYDNDGVPESDFAREAWDFYNGNLIIQAPYVASIRGSLYLKTGRKWTVADNIPDYLVSYIINMAIYYTTELLATGFVNRFLKNDVSMSDLINRGNMALSNAQRQRQALRRNQSPVRV